MNPHYHFGTLLGAALHDIDRDELARREASEAVMQSEEAAPYHRELAKMAAVAFELDGKSATTAGQLFRNLAQERNWHPSYYRFTDPVRRALTKVGAPLLPVATAAHDSLGGGMMKNLLAGGVLGGGALGSLAYLLTRNAEQTSVENEQLLQKIRAYKEMRQEIEEDAQFSQALNDSQPQDTTYNV